jgi:hypothetical protein
MSAERQDAPDGTRAGLGEGDHYVTLATIGDGAAEEYFQEELTKVLKNVMDPNTIPTAIREITVKIRIKPNEERRIGDADVLCTSKLAPIKRRKTVLYMGMHHNRPVAVESNPEQRGLFENKPVITPFPATSTPAAGEKGAV